jgi:predicted permease
VTSDHAADAAIGDAFEELDDRQARGRGPRWPALWLRWRLVGAITAAIGAAIPRWCRSAAVCVRHAVHAIRSAPKHSAFVVCVLTAGITLATVTFSVVDAVILKPLPIEEADRLVSLNGYDFAARRQRITGDSFWQLQGHLETAESSACWMNMSGNIVTAEGLTEADRVTLGTADLFRVLRFGTAIGRLWTADDEARGDTRVAVLGYRFWRERFGGRADALGKTVTIDNRLYVVIGVLSQETDHPESEPTNAPIWVPAVPRRGAVGIVGNLLIRMRPGVTPSQVAGEVERVMNTPDWKADVRPLLDVYGSETGRWMLLALGASLLVMLVACANAANLMLTRAVVRTQELAVRASLGASRRQLAFTVLTESLFLTLAATLTGLLLSVAGVRIIKAALLNTLPGTFRATTVALNGRVCAAAVACAVLTGVLCALVPAWQTSKAQVSVLLKDSEAPTTTSRRRWRSAFLIAEVSSVTVLLVATWLFVYSLVQATTFNLGLDRSVLAGVTPRIPFRTNVADAVQRLQSVPGVVGVSATRGAGLPVLGRAFGAAWITSKVRLAVGDSADATPLEVLYYRVTSNYFEVAGLPFRAGGTWQAGSPENSGVGVIDDLAAKALFGATNPVGLAISSTESHGILTVLGVVPHVQTYGATGIAQPSIYVPLTNDPGRRFADLLVRTSGSARDMLPALTQAIAPVAPAPNERIVHVMDEAVSSLTALRRFNAALMSVFGLAGALIGAAGVYAVMSSFVAQQTREFGVRLALGATPGHIQRGVLTLAWRHLLAGLAIGLPLAWWLSRGLDSLLFQVTTADVSVYAVVAVALSGIGLVAAWLPARRAAHTDPIASLRK